MPRFRAALHGGRVVAGEVGVDRRKIAYFGDTVNTTARLESLCRDMDTPILISAELLARIPALPPDVHATNLGAHILRGRDHPLGVLALTSGSSGHEPVRKDRRSRLKASHLRQRHLRPVGRRSLAGRRGRSVVLELLQLIEHRLAVGWRAAGGGGLARRRRRHARRRSIENGDGLPPIGLKHGEQDAREKEGRGENGRRPRERIRLAASGEKAGNAARAAAQAQSPALRALQQHDADEREHDEKMDDDQHILHGTPCCAFAMNFGSLGWVRLIR